MNFLIFFPAIMANIAIVQSHKGHHHHQHHHHHHLEPYDFQDHFSDRELKSLFEENRGCGTLDPPEQDQDLIEKEIQNYKNIIGASQLLRTKNSPIEIDVFFHIFAESTGNGEIPPQTIQKQIDILNDAFAGQTSSYSGCGGFTYLDQPSSPFRFNLIEVVTTLDDEAFQLNSPPSRSKVAELRRGDCSTLNIFTGNADFLGMAYYPHWCPRNGDPTDVSNVRDGVLLNYKSLPEMGADRYDEGDTLVHEVGHWLGLYHTFHEGCDGEGDMVFDTPAESSGATGCPVGRNTCGAPGDASGDDPIHNFMDYTDDCCMYKFSAGQTERMVLEAGLYRGLHMTASEPPTPFPSPLPTYFPAETPTDTPSTSPSFTSSQAPTPQPSPNPTQSPTPQPSSNLLKLQSHNPRQILLNLQHHNPRQILLNLQHHNPRKILLKLQHHNPRQILLKLQRHNPRQILLKLQHHNPRQILLKLQRHNPRQILLNLQHHNPRQILLNLQHHNPRQILLKLQHHNPRQILLMLQHHKPRQILLNLQHHNLRRILLMLQHHNLRRILLMLQHHNPHQILLNLQHHNHHKRTLPMILGVSIIPKLT